MIGVNNVSVKYIMGDFKDIGIKEYLIKNCKEMPRVAYRYALEKFDKETRNKLMQM